MSKKIGAGRAESSAERSHFRLIQKAFDNIESLFYCFCKPSIPLCFRQSITQYSEKGYNRTNRVDSGKSFLAISSRFVVSLSKSGEGELCKTKKNASPRLGRAAYLAYVVGRRDWSRAVSRVSFCHKACRAGDFSRLRLQRTDYVFIMRALGEMAIQKPVA